MRVCPSPSTIALGGLLLAACTPSALERSSELGVDGASIAAETTGLLAIVLDQSSTVTPQQAAQNAVAQIPLQFGPVGCASAQVQGDVLTLSFSHDGCTDVQAGVWLDGTLTVTFATTAAGLSAHLTTQSLSSRSRPVDIDATATWGGLPGNRTLSVKATTHADGDHVAGLVVTANLSARWDGQCVGLDGSFDASGAGSTGSFGLSNYVQCGDGCPRSGVATFALEGGSGKITWSGGTLATLSDGTTSTYSLALRCESE